MSPNCMNNRHGSRLVLLFVIGMLLCAVFNRLYAQDAGQTRSLFTNEFTLPFTSNVSLTKTTNDDSLLAVVQYRIRYDMLFFTRVPAKAGMKSDDLMAPLTITLEVVGKDGITYQTQQIVDTVFIASLDKARSKRNFYVGIRSFSLPSSSVALVVDISKATNRLKTTRYRYLTKRILSGDSTISILAFSDKQSTYDAKSGKAFAFQQGTMLNDTVSFGSHARLLCFLPSMYQSGEWNYTIYPDTVKDEASYVQSGGGIVGSMMVEEKHLVVQSASRSGEPNTVLLEQGGSNMIGLLDFDASSCQEGNYRLLAVSQFGDTLRSKFVVQWSTKPLSLRDLDYSLGLMRYLLNDAATREMIAGGTVDARKKFETYWAQRDPTPETAFNEDMSEYFARADYAYFAFAGVGVADGARTDRGRVYILNGKPSSVESRILPNNVRREVWRYTDRVFKEFIFESGNSGALVLKNVQDSVPENRE